jgi:hypothetical protein
LNFAVGWKVEATEERNMRDHVDLHIEKTEIQQSRMQKESHPLEQLDKDIEKIRKLILRSAQETASEEELRRRRPAIAVGKIRQQSRGVDGQLQRIVWDPGGFQQPCWEAHE